MGHRPTPPPRARLAVRIGRILVDAPLDLGAEMGDEALDRPGRGVAERADRVALDLLGDVEQHVDLALLRAALGHARHHPPHPAGAFAAGRALAAALVLVEIRQPRDRAHDVGRLVHHDHRRGAEAGAQLAQRIEIHRAVDDLRGRHQRTDEPPGMTASRLSQPPRTPPQCLLDQFAERDRHRLFDVARLVDVAGDAEELGAGIVGRAEAREPGRAAAQDGRRDGDRLDVVDRRRAAIEADIGRERRLHPRHALLALERLEHRGLFAADIGAGAVMDVEIERPAVDVVLADQPGLIGLVDRRLQTLALR